MKPVACPICQNQTLKLISRISRRTIFQCLNCSLIFANLQTANDKIWCNHYRQEENYLLPFFQKKLSEIKKRKKPGKILDVGCATGLFLKLAQKQGWQVSGVDTSFKATKYCQRNFAPKQIFCGRLEQAHFKNNFFDVITVFNTLEHIANLFSFLSEAKKVLKKDGLLIIFVPNQAGFTSKIFGRYWHDYATGEHLYFFTPKTLRLVLERVGLKVIFIKQDFCFKHAPLSNRLTKIRSCCPFFLVNKVSFWAETLLKIIGIKNIFFPSEHLYATAQKS